MKRHTMREGLTKSEYLALVRSQLANERTFLAYFRTFAVLLSSGFALIKIEAFSHLQELGYGLLLGAALVLIVGIARFFYVKRAFRKLLDL